MALPKLNTQTYELEVPSTDEKIRYRPFLVKEEKILLVILLKLVNVILLLLKLLLAYLYFLILMIFMKHQN